MRRKLFIHVGAGKTGTSALQDFFFANEERLAQKGVVFPKHGRSPNKISIAHHPLAWRGRFRLGEEADVLALWREIAALEQPRLVVSSEFFHGKVTDPDGPAFFEKLKEMFHDTDIRIVFYLRRQSQWLQSAYAQWVKNNLQSRTFQKFVRSFAHNPVDQVFAYAEVFGSEAMIVRPFERGQFAGGSIQRDFCAAIGINWDDAFVLPEGNPNPRFAGDALELKRQINRFAGTARELRAIQRDLQAYSDLVGRDSRSVFVSHAMLDRTEQQRIENENEPKYARIARDFLGRADGVLFRDPLPQAPETAEADEGAVATDQVRVYLLMQIHHRIERLRRKLKTKTP
ncbi:hypothetical protein [Marimonas arenosa]|uniref:Sulfotransferase family protein n=1 Tax=Marimonas arenosa TaxID=1795305 RepID=A0AAE3WGK9_9RHOB|nr:hypothetical protein [Marimonas arenosa]MDQ2092274.1 hypothetical protein [Marimonas arenosa]